jgi:hypothetical protein
MNSILSIHWFMVGAFWYFINGVLHDIFVIRQHGGKYNRELLRLLMDGHVLILSGLLMLGCWFMAKGDLVWSSRIGMVVSLFMVIYCAMIFPFLKSFGTIVLSVILFLVALFHW